jgi:hypothetical protein
LGRSSEQAASDLIKVFGHVVADDVFGDVYMIPLHDIINDIKTTMNATVVRLPKTIREVGNIATENFRRALAESVSEPDSDDKNDPPIKVTAEQTKGTSVAAGMSDDSLDLDPYLQQLPSRSENLNDFGQDDNRLRTSLAAANYLVGGDDDESEEDDGEDEDTSDGWNDFDPYVTR